jgi:hypothetical protein
MLSMIYRLIEKGEVACVYTGYMCSSMSDTEKWLGPQVCLKGKWKCSLPKKCNLVHHKTATTCSLTKISQQDQLGLAPFCPNFSSTSVVSRVGSLFLHFCPYNHKILSEFLLRTVTTQGAIVQCPHPLTHFLLQTRYTHPLKSLSHLSHCFSPSHSVIRVS